MKKRQIIAAILAVALILAGCSQKAAEQEIVTEFSTIETIDLTEINGQAETVVPTAPVHEHDYVEIVIVATCMDDGCTVFVCECGDAYNDGYVAALGHTWSEWVTTAEPTAETEGSSERTCESCHITETRVIPKEISDHTHEYRETVTKKPTCTEFGEKLVVCSCGDQYTEVMAKVGHDYEKTVTEPTCTSKGYTFRQCKDCSYSYTGDYVSKAEHVYTAVVTKEPTCSEEGSAIYTCQCGESHTDSVDKLAHSYTDSTVAPTCEKRGYTVYTCECGDTYQDRYVDASGHSWSDWNTTMEATETSEGAAERVCNICGTKEEKTIAKIIKDHVHSYTSKETKAPTCSAFGETTFTCTCGDSYTEKIEKLSHSYESKTVAPTCTKRGYTEYTCTVCGSNYCDGYTDTLEHAYTSKVTTEPTCSKVGVCTYTCSDCGYTKNEDVEKVEHSCSANVIAPTCYEEGYTVYRCEVCGHTYQDDKIPALGHNFSEVVVNPTCNDEGYTRRICSHCNYQDLVSETPAKGHSYEVFLDTATCTADGTKTEICSVCGDQRTSSSAATGHVDTRTETVEPNCVYEGYTRVTCVCGEILSNTVYPAGGGHSYETKNLAAAAKVLVDQGDNDYLEYTKFRDWNAQVCKNCDYIDLETIEFAYSAYEAAAIMLGYVNDLRESVYGTSEYNLELSSELISLANIRAEEIYHEYGHGGTYTGAGENIARGGPNIYDHFLAWKNSSGHYANMIEQRYKYFGYALYKPDGYRNTAVYGVQLFWQE